MPANNGNARAIIFAATPLTFNRCNALLYTGISEKLFRQLEKSGSLVGRPIGRNGEIMFRKEQLMAVTAQLFEFSSSDIDDEFGPTEL